MFVYSWGQNIVWKELIFNGKSRMLLVRYKYFAIMFIFVAAYSKSYFLRKEDRDFDIGNPNLFTDGSIEEISLERLRAINNGKLVSVGWWRNWSLLLLIWIIILGIIFASFNKPNTSLSKINPNQTPQANKNEPVVTDKLIDTTQKLIGVKGIEFVEPVWDLEQIHEYLSSKDGGKYNTEDVAFVYTKTSQNIFDQFIDDLTKNKTEVQLEKSLKFQKSAKEMGEFMKNFPTALASYQNNQESIKNFFFNDTQKICVIPS